MQKISLLFCCLQLCTACAQKSASEQGLVSGGQTISVGQVTDDVTIDDESFNFSVWEGIARAGQTYGVEIRGLVPKNEDGEQAAIQRLIDENTDLIVTAGYTMGLVTNQMALANPSQKFILIDAESNAPNVTGVLFQVDKAAFLAGYLAAGMSKTGKVATYGGMKIPTVTAFMNGFKNGIENYNQSKGAAVQLLGWDGENGLFLGDFTSNDKARMLTQDLINQGADIIMPVAGPAGLVSASLCLSINSCLVIGADTDWARVTPEYRDALLSSVLKRSDVVVFKLIGQVLDGTLTGGTVTFGLKEGAVDLAPYHATVPSSLQDEVNALKQQQIGG